MTSDELRNSKDQPFEKKTVTGKAPEQWSLREVLAPPGVREQSPQAVIESATPTRIL